MLPHVAYNAPSAIIVGTIVANAMMGRDHNGEIKMSKLHKSLALLLASGATALSGPTAFAQGGASAGPTLEEIVVTARKREESLQDIPVAVTALTTKDIENRQMESINDVAKFAPGLLFSSTFGRSTERPVMRGLGSILAGGTVPTVESGVAYFVNGVYYPGDIQAIDMSDVQRVEVIRGPQSALYGRNTYSGAINFILKKPGDRTTAGVSFGADAEERRGSARISGPMTSKLAGSLSVRYNQFDGQRKNELTGKTIGKEQSFDLSTALNFTPTDNVEADVHLFTARNRDGTRPFFFQSPSLNNCYPGTRSLASYATTDTPNPYQYYCGEVKVPSKFYLNDEPVTQTIVPLPGLPASFNSGASRATGTGNYETTEALPFSGVNRDVTLVTGSYHWNVLGSGYNVVFNGGSRYDALKTGSDSDHSALNIIGPPVNGIRRLAYGSSSGWDRYRDWSAEAKLESPREQRVRWAAGVFHFEYEQRSYVIDYGSLNGQDNPYRIVDIANNAIYGLVEADFTDRLSGTFELRKAKERKGQIDYTQVTNLQIGPTVMTYDSRLRGNDRWNSSTPRATLTFKATPDVTLYANYAKGFKPGGFNGAAAINAGRPADERFLEEESTNYEIGAKALFFDRRFLVNLALFKIDNTNMQLTEAVPTAIGTTTSISTNQGNGEVKGVEIETKFAATDSLTLGLNYALADSKFTKG